MSGVRVGISGKLLGAFVGGEDTGSRQETGPHIAGRAVAPASHRGLESSMKMSHLATFLLIIMGGAVQNVGEAVRRRLQRSRGRE
jgi:hypothetical protein